MKLNPKDSEDLVAGLVGRDALNVLRLIKNKRNVSEFKLAESLKQNINQVRNVLYRMNEYNLVGFIRKKDKKKGWYIYYWTFEENEAAKIYIMLKRKRLEELREAISKGKEEMFFVCKTDLVKFSMEDALNMEFRCPECGKVLKEEKVIIDVEKIRREIDAIEHDLKSKEDATSKKPNLKNKAKNKKTSNTKVTKKAK
ncbi:hypothetical protein J4231_01495 [Candidatus Woesearchaeota archaeon]|nr:hypothetical protein [Candidatus Woesearchaeota archaeon]